MTMHDAMHLLGCTCLGAIAVIAVSVLGDAVCQHRRIRAALRREPIPPAQPLDVVVRWRSGFASYFAAPSGPTSTPAHDAGCTGARTRRA